MSTDATPAPGSLTVPPLFGWEGLVALLVAAVVIGVGFLVLSAVSASRRPSADWDAWLQGRSRGTGTRSRTVPRGAPSSDRTSEGYGDERSP